MQAEQFIEALKSCGALDFDPNNHTGHYVNDKSIRRRPEGKQDVKGFATDGANSRYIPRSLFHSEEVKYLDNYKYPAAPILVTLTLIYNST